MGKQGQVGTADVWQAWYDEFMRVLLPTGLGPRQHFAAGQTTLVVDFANPDPLITNAEIFRIGNTMPAASPNFARQGTLFDAYRLFLGRIDSEQVDDAKKSVEAANSQALNELNMNAKVGTIAPDGSQPQTIGDPSPPLPSALRTVCLPAYGLDAGFRGKYQEWQALSAQGKSTAGGTISVT